MVRHDAERRQPLEQLYVCYYYYYSYIIYFILLFFSRLALSALALYNTLAVLFSTFILADGNEITRDMYIFFLVAQFHSDKNRIRQYNAVVFIIKHN